MLNSQERIFNRIWRGKKSQSAITQRVKGDYKAPGDSLTDCHKAPARPASGSLEWHREHLSGRGGGSCYGGPPLPVLQPAHGFFVLTSSAGAMVKGFRHRGLGDASIVLWWKTERRKSTSGSLPVKRW